VTDFLTAVATGQAQVKSAERDLWKLAELAAHVDVDGFGVERWEGEVGLSLGTGSILVRIWRRWGGAVVTDRPLFLDAWVAMAAPLHNGARR
jgi:hypothetical protein